MPRAGNLVRFELEGPGDLVAVDNGDATSHASFQAREMRVYNGLCLAIVRLHKGAATPLKLTARSEGLAPAQAVIYVVRP